MLTNREIATLILVVAFAIFVLLKPTVRQSVVKLVRAFMTWKMLVPVVSYFVYAAIAVGIAWRIGIWDTTILKETVIWIFFTGLPIFFRANQLKSGAGVLRRTVLEAVAASAFVAFYLNLYSFPLVWEILLQAVLAFLAALEVVARHQGPKTRPVANVIGLLLFGIAIFMMWRTGVWLAENWNQLNHDAIVMSLGMMVWLPITLVPYIYIFTYVLHCESSLRMVRFFNQEKQLKVPIVLAFLLGTRLSVRYAGSFTGTWRNQLARSRVFGGALRVMAEYRQSLRDQDAAERAAKKRLKDYAGVDGVDNEGRRLDRREFEETQQALSYLWTCMLGHARNRKNRYRDDLLPLLDFHRHELPADDDHDIQIKVAKDEKSWYAWRRTVTGWVFGIGGNQDDLTIEWRYDGLEPPNEYPGQRQYGLE